MQSLLKSGFDDSRIESSQDFCLILKNDIIKGVKILMLGWELPPFNSGGLGVACLNLAEALSKQNCKITFILPKKVGVTSRFFKIIFADDSENPILLCPYRVSKLLKSDVSKHHLNNLIGDVFSFAIKTREIAKKEDFDVIHAHDWLAFPAGIEAKLASGKPLVVHVHATEFDRTGGHGINETVYQIEKMGMETADRVITVSHFTKNIVIHHYQIPPEKIKVVWNGINPEPEEKCAKEIKLKEEGKKIVLFVGRITIQKGADYLVKAAKMVLEYNPNVIFVIAGTGDMEGQILQEVINLGISDKVLFTGFLRDKALKDLYRAADVFVLPSISEPFGLTALEALMNNTPVILSKQSGVSEVITHSLKVDFWDIEEMAHKILAILAYEPLREWMKQKGKEEITSVNWDSSAKKCVEVYKQLIPASA